jgi:hypothetical protein
MIIRSKWATGSDRLLAGTRFIGGFGELDVPDRSDLRVALKVVLEAGPRTRISLEPVKSRRLWRSTAAEPPVFALPDEVAAGTIARMMEYVRRRPGPRLPFEVHVSRNHVILDIDHGLGDGRFAMELLEAVFALVNGNRHPWVEMRGTPMALPRAILNTFGHHPARALAALRSFVAMRYSPQGDPVLDHGERTPWSPSLAVGVAHVDASAEGDVEEWRRSNPGKPGSAAVWFYVVRKAIQAAGINVQERSLFAFDSRRYLAEGQAVKGNFIVGLSVPIGADEQPTQINDRIRGLIDSGVPLAGQAAIGLRSLIAAHGETAMGTIQRTGVPADIMYTDLGRIPFLDGAPWRETENRTITALVDPAGPHSLTILNGRVRSIRNIAITYHDNVFDREIIDEATKYMSEPMQFLQPG